MSGIWYRDMTIREVLAVYNGTLKRQSDEMEFQKRVIFNAERLGIFYSLVSNPHLKKKPSKPEDVIQFDWDEGRKRMEKPTQEQWDEWNKMFPDKI